jgi:hypothetical protein
VNRLTAKRVRATSTRDERIAAPRATLTTRACRWVIEQIRREHASVNGVRRQLGTGWRTVWDAVKAPAGEGRQRR